MILRNNIWQYQYLYQQNNHDNICLLTLHKQMNYLIEQTIHSIQLLFYDHKKNNLDLSKDHQDLKKLLDYLFLLTFQNIL